MDKTARAFLVCALMTALIPQSSVSAEGAEAKQEESKRLSCLEFAMSKGHTSVPYLFRECMYEQQGPKPPKAKTYCSKRSPKSTPWCVEGE